MNELTIRKLFPNASPSLIALNTREASVVECNSSEGPLAESKDEKANPRRVHIRFVSVRKRLLDPDNISEKWMLDALRFAGVIQGDEPDKITLETTQRKVEKGEEEHTEIDIWEEI